MHIGGGFVHLYVPPVALEQIDSEEPVRTNLALQENLHRLSGLLLFEQVTFPLIGLV